MNCTRNLEDRVSPSGDTYRISMIDVDYSEPETWTVGAGLVPAFEPHDVNTVLGDDTHARRYVSVALYRLNTTP